MATRNPRIGLSPSDEAYAVITELSQLTGESRARIVHGLVDAALPALRFTIESLKQYQSATNEAEKAALQSVYAKTEQGLERLSKKLFQETSNALAGAGTGTGDGDTAGDASTASARGDDANAGAGTGAGKQGGANANGNP